MYVRCDVTPVDCRADQMNEDIGQAEEELAEFRNESQLMEGERGEKFRELRSRDAQMESFFDTFPSSKEELEGKIAKLSDEVIKLLRLISLNCRHIGSVTGVDESVLDRTLGGVVGTNATELQDLHLRLQEELASLDSNKFALDAELEGMKRRQEEIDANKDQLNDDERHREEVEARRKVKRRSKRFESETSVVKGLEERRDELVAELSTIEGESTQTMQQVDSNERRLSSSAN